MGAVWVIATLTVAPQSAPATAEPSPFTAGTGAANATLLSPAIAAGNLALTVVTGASSSNFQDRSARGQSTSVDVPVLRAASSTRVCGQLIQGVGAYLPPIVAADTATTSDAKPVDAHSTNEPGFDQSANAQPAAHGAAETKIVSAGLLPLVSMASGDASTDVRADGAAHNRIVTAHSSFGDVQVLDGLVTLKGLRWDLQQTIAGNDNRADHEKVTGGFSLQSITIAVPGAPTVAIPVPTTGDAADAFAKANTLLAKLGVQLRLPRQTDNPESRGHVISPLTVAIGGRDWVAGPPIGTVLTGKTFQQISQLALHTLFDTQHCQQLDGLMQALGPQLNAQYNNLGAAAPLVLAVVAGSLGGTGEIQLNLGGVSTTIDDTYYPPLDFAPPAFGRAAPGSPALAGVAPVPGLPGASSPGTATASPAGAPAAAVNAQRAVSTSCQTSSPAGVPGCWLGHGPAGALTAAGFTVALLAVDEVYRRRYRRLHLAEDVDA